MGLRRSGVYRRRVAFPRYVYDYGAACEKRNSGTDAAWFYRFLERLQYVDDIYAEYTIDCLRFVPLSVFQRAGSEFDHDPACGVYNRYVSAVRAVHGVQKTTDRQYSDRRTERLNLKSKSCKKMI